MKYFEVDVEVTVKKTVRVKVPNKVYDAHMAAMAKAMEGEKQSSNVILVKATGWNLVKETKDEE